MLARERERVARNARVDDGKRAPRHSGGRASNAVHEMREEDFQTSLLCLNESRHSRVFRLNAALPASRFFFFFSFQLRTLALKPSILGTLREA
jgi:hypothetical protein